MWDRDESLVKKEITAREFSNVELEGRNFQVAGPTAKVLVEGKIHGCGWSKYFRSGATVYIICLRPKHTGSYLAT